jgi:hypothetical protein
MHGHPYHKLGLRSYSFYELLDSDLVKSLDDTQKVHPFYNPKQSYLGNHYIITFHDSMFECVATDFEIRSENKTLNEQVLNLLAEMQI